MGRRWRFNEANSKFNLILDDRRIQTLGPSILKMARKLEPGRYIAVDIHSGSVLDLPLENNQPPHAWGYHGEENQQVRTIIGFLTLGAGGADPSSFSISPFRCGHDLLCATTLCCQWDFCPCGAGFIINSVYSSGSFVTVRPDLKDLHLDGSTQVVTGAFPTCWEVEVLPASPTDKPGEVFAR